MDEQMREKFEAWFSNEGQYPKAVERSGDGYKLMTAQTAWEAWQACAAALSQPAAAESITLDALDELYGKEIVLVSNVAYNSNSICRWFYKNLRDAIVAKATP